MSNYTEDELALLTPEERESINYTDDLGDELPEVGNDDPEEQEQTDAVTDTPEQAAPVVELEELTEPEAAHDAPMQYQIDSPADSSARLTQLAEEKTALAAELQGMDIELSEYHVRLDAINQQEQNIRMAVREAELVSNINKQNAEKAWAETCDNFVTSHDEYKDNPVMLDILNRNVIAIAHEAGNANLTGQQVLAKAHAKAIAEASAQFEKMAKALGKNVIQAAPQAKPQINKPKLPQTLSGLPTAEPTETGGDEFAAIDRLSGSAQEDAISRLSDSQRNRYLGLN